jgi:hypothetical protein
MRDLTENQRIMLRRAAANALGVVEKPHLPGFEGVTWDRNATKLCKLGLLKPYVHGGHEITEAGRKVLKGSPGDEVLAEVVKWALDGHISELGVSAVACDAIRAVANGVKTPDGGKHGA